MKQATTQKKATAAKAETKQVVASPRSLMRLINMLDSLAKAPDGLTLAELSQTLNAPKSSLLLLLRPLTADHYLIHGGSRYHLGAPIFRLASDILSGRRFPKLIRPYMERLAEATGETVILGALDRDSKRVTYIEVVEGTQTIRYAVPAGTSRPLHASTAGRVLLAFQEEGWREQYLRSEKLKAFTAETIVDRSVLRKSIAEIRKRGWGIGYGQMVAGAAAISAPILDANKEAMGALMIGAPADRLKSKEAEFTKEVLSAAARVSGDLRGFSGVSGM